MEPYAFGLIGRKFSMPEQGDDKPELVIIFFYIRFHF